MVRRLLVWGAMAVGVLLIGIQAIPYGRGHVNPPVRQEPRWDSPQTRALAVTACYDCHSNETAWPWYSHVAPVSWLVQSDVERGRSKMNFSEWDRPSHEGHEAPEAVGKGKMPLWSYVNVHSKARLTALERRALLRGLAATMAPADRGRRKANDAGVHRLRGEGHG